MSDKNFFPNAVSTDLETQRKNERAAAAKRLAERMGEDPEADVAPLTSMAQSAPAPTALGKLTEPSGEEDNAINVGDGTGGTTPDTFIKPGSLSGAVSAFGSGMSEGLHDGLSFGKDMGGQLYGGVVVDPINAGYDFLSFVAQAPLIGPSAAASKTFGDTSNNLITPYPHSDRMIPSMTRFMLNYAPIAMATGAAIEATPALAFIGAGTELSAGTPALLRAANSPMVKQLIVGSVADAVVSSQQENLSKMISDYAREHGHDPGLFEQYMAIDPNDPNATQLHNSLAAVIEGAVIQGAFHSLGAIGSFAKPYAAKAMMKMLDAAKAQRAVRAAQPEVAAAADAAAHRLGTDLTTGEIPDAIDPPIPGMMGEAPPVPQPDVTDGMIPVDADPAISFDTASGAGATTAGVDSMLIKQPGGSPEFEAAVAADDLEGGVDSEGGQLAARLAKENAETDIQKIRQGIEEDFRTKKWLSARVLFRTYSRDLWGKVWENRDSFAKPMTKAQFKLLRRLWDAEALRWGNDHGVPAELWYRHHFGDNPAEMIQFLESGFGVIGSPSALMQRFGMPTKFFHGNTSVHPPMTRDTLENMGNPFSRVGPGLYVAPEKKKWFANLYAAGFESEDRVNDAFHAQGGRMPYGRMTEFTFGADFDALDIRKRVSELPDGDRDRAVDAMLKAARLVDEHIQDAARNGYITLDPKKDAPIIPNVKRRMENGLPLSNPWSFLIAQYGRLTMTGHFDYGEVRSMMMEAIYRPLREAGFDGIIHDEPLAYPRQASRYFGGPDATMPGEAMMVMDPGDELGIGRKPQINSVRTTAAPMSKLRGLVFGSTNTSQTMSIRDALLAASSATEKHGQREQLVALADAIAAKSDGRVELTAFGPHEGAPLTQYDNPLKTSPDKYATGSMGSHSEHPHTKVGVGVWGGLADGGQEDFYAIGLNFAEDVTEEEAKQWTWRIASELGLASNQKAMAPVIIDVSSMHNPAEGLADAALLATDDLFIAVETKRPAVSEVEVSKIRADLESIGVKNASIDAESGAVFISSPASGAESDALRTSIYNWSKQNGYETFAERAIVPDGGIIGDWADLALARSEFDRAVAEHDAAIQARPAADSGAAGGKPGAGDAVGNQPDASGTTGPLYQYRVGDFADGDGRKFFSPQALAEAGAKTAGNSRSIIVYLSPDEYLSLAKGDTSEVKRAATAEVAAAGGKFDSVPSLKFRHEQGGLGVVFEQDGQHRALALKEQGVKLMPVVVESDGGTLGSIRWSDARQADIPDILVGQDGVSKVPFPANGGEQFQRVPGEPTPKGMIDFDADGKAIITMFKGKADFSTFMHETGHLFFRDLETMSGVDRDALAQWAGVPAGTAFKSWPVDAQEKWARGFENFAATGDAPNAGLERLFARQRGWMREVYGKIIGTEIDVQLSPEVSKLMSDIFAGTTTKAAPRMTFTRDKQTGVAFINHDRIYSQEDIDGLMQAVADAQTKMVDAATGGEHIRQLADVQRDARAMKMSVPQLLGLPLTMTDSQALAARELEIASAESVVKLADVARKSGDAEDLIRFRRAVTVHRAINAHVRGQSRTASRLLGSRRVIARSSRDRLRAVEEMVSMEGVETVRGLADKLSALHDNPEAVDGFIRELEKATKWDAVHEVFINNLLSAPATYFANSIGNSATVALGLMHTTIGAVGDRVFGNSENVDFQEVAESVTGIIRGMSDGWELAKKAFDDEYVGAGKYEDGLTKQRRAIVAETFNQKEGTTLGDAINAIGRTWRGPTRALRSADAFFNSVAYRMELHRLAYRDAVETARAAGQKMTKEELGLHMANFLTSPPGEVIKKAEKFALKQTFMEEFEGKLGRFASQTSGTPYLRKIVPFARTPLQIMKYGMEETPFAVLSKDFRKQLTSSNANEATIARSRLALSTAMFFAVGDLVDRGLLTPSYSPDPGERESQMRTGVYECSIAGSVDGPRTAINRIEPVGTALCMMADVWNAIDKLDNQQSDELAIAVTLHLADNMMSKTSLAGFSNIVTGIRQGRGEMVNTVISNLVSAHAVPGYSLVSAAERALDPALRDKTVSPVDPGIGWINRIVGEAMSHIPAMSDAIPMSFDLWGRAKTSVKRSNPTWMGKLYEFASPVAVGSEDKDVADIERAFQRNGYFPAMPTKFLTSENGGSVRLTTKEYERFVQRSGAKALKEIRANWDEINAMPDDGANGDKMETIKRIISDVRADVADEMFGAIPPARVAAAEANMGKVVKSRQWGVDKKMLDGIRVK